MNNIVKKKKTKCIDYPAIKSRSRDAVLESRSRENVGHLGPVSNRKLKVSVSGLNVAVSEFLIMQRTFVMLAQVVKAYL